MERKLTAILSADVKGYSRLMGDDELATVRTLTAYREVLTTLIQAHRGRVVDSPGDNLLAEFASVVGAVQCATEIQHELMVRNAELPVHRQMAFRIGINVGDVLTEDGRLYGDGVNIAARLEGLAEAGGICISEMAYIQVKNKLTLLYEYIGEQQVKNIAEPVRVWRIKTELEGGCSAGGEGSPKSQVPDPKSTVQGPQTRRIGTVRWSRIVLVGLFLATGLATILYFSLPALRDQTTLALSLKPSIAVLPFVNMSADTSQEYFSDGMTDTLITDLSKLAALFVIARNSTFVYKGKTTNPQQVGQELGVQYVVEGSVQKAEAQVRVNVQLIDTTTGHHLWAERYDRELKDIFALQDELTRRIVGALQVKLTTSEQGRVGRVPTDNLEAYDYYLRGKVYWERATAEANGQARQLFERAIALDPQFALAYTALGATYLRAFLWFWSYDPQALERTIELAEKARALGDAVPEAHALLGVAYASKGQPEQGLAEGERAIALDPNCARCHIALAEVLLLAGQPTEALGLVEKAIRLDPESAAFYAFDLGLAYHSLGRYEEAIAAQQRVLTRNPDFLPARVELARLYNELGREEEARREEAAARQINPNILLDDLRGDASLKKQKTEPEGFFARSSARMKAYGYYLSGGRHFLRFTQEEHVQARQMFEKAIELDPQFALAHTLLGSTYLHGWAFQWSQDSLALEQALALVRQALTLDDTSPVAHQLLSSVYLGKKQHERAIIEAERAVTLDPDEADSYLVLGIVYIYAGRPEDGIGFLEKGIRLKPRLPGRDFAFLGLAYYLTGRHEEAVDALRKALSLDPNWGPTHIYLAILYSTLGREKEARAEVAEFLKFSPNFSLEVFRQREPYKDPAITERVVAALRTAGLK